MAEDWTPEEVEATVADYFDMLDKELRHVEYNKTAHRRLLATLLNRRSDTAIERKHQNISAILNTRLHFPYIFGYKPLGNYQQLLYDVVSDRFARSPDLVKIVQTQIEEPASAPTVDDILASLIDPPVPVPLAHGRKQPVLQDSLSQYRVDYLAQEAGNRSLGSAGEQFVLQYEKARLTRSGQTRLASRVEHVSVTQGDAAGFDVLSFETDGRERLIEVKTTAYGNLTPFYVTRNEVDTSRKADSAYYLYRAFEFRRRPWLFAKQGALDRSFNLDPSQYLARLS